MTCERDVVGTQRAQGVLIMEDVNETRDTILTLPTGTSATDIAKNCREAAMEFVNCSETWGRPELMMWLTGSYARLTAHAAAATGTETASSVWPVPLLSNINDKLIGRIIRTARAEVLETLSRIANDGSASFVLRALIAGSVVRCEDGMSEPAWAPTGEPTRLADRVLSLFAVDYLACAGDYEAELVVCSKCSSVTFGESHRSHGTCCHQGAIFSAAAPRQRATLPYPPMGA
jgi:hypothetical protein